MPFTKMHGIGNDFVVINCLHDALSEERLPGWSIALNDRRFGIGGDGLILVLPSRSADFRMRMFNPDGTEAEMCGNGIRCFARWVYDAGLTNGRQLTVETLAGVKNLRLDVRNGAFVSVRVDMGEPVLKPKLIPMRVDGDGPVVGQTINVDGKKVEITAVSMGNPHAVLFVADAGAAAVSRLGPLIESHRLFPSRTNVQFVQVLGRNEIKVRTWERGAGETLACGTGACAAVVASVLNRLTARHVTVHLPGGDLSVEWLGDSRVVMTGPAAVAFHGEIALA
ncbi:MAG: diaminopimelate epimerase [Armatimonadetes bacterium]|nr:diaminopimelate epimerase [Armatimonadota bacterium]MDE2205423.1 diaminopimelate epimerase [Armatimonadota bacterium]